MEGVPARQAQSPALGTFLWPSERKALTVALVLRDGGVMQAGRVRGSWVALPLLGAGVGQ
jgi:hypothetical protein